ncbi:MAG: hypothetical protein IJ299_00880, partial [Oscillospiraceae bacterium]|nr:hypothetical protein [Oscillospiraceae bacterium]
MRQVNRTGFRNAFAHLAILTIISGEFLHCFLRPESFVKSTILKLLGIISGIILIKLLLRIQTKNPQCQHPIG